MSFFRKLSHRISFTRAHKSIKHRNVCRKIKIILCTPPVILELCNCEHIAHPSQEAPAYSGVLELACRVSHVNMKFVRGLILRVVVTRSDASSRILTLSALAEHSGARLAPTFLQCTEPKRCLILFKIK